MSAMLQRWRRAGDAPRARLYAFAHAGAGAADLRAFAAHAPAWLDVAAVRLPGRERRVAEPLPQSLAAVVDEAAATILGEWRTDLPVFLFGQCAGGLIAFETARRLCAQGAMPAGLALSAPPSPDQDFAGAAQIAASADFAASMNAMGALPDEVLADPVLLDVVLPALRADFALFEGYRNRADAPLPLPVLAVAGDADALSPFAALAQWRPRSGGGLRACEIGGGHLLAAETPQALMALVAGFALERLQEQEPAQEPA